MCSKWPPPARTHAYRRWCHSPVITFDNRVTQSSPLTVDVSFQFVNVWGLGTIDSLLKHTPHGVVNQVERSGELSGQRVGGIKSGISWSSSATMSLALCDGALSNFQMMHKCQEAAAVSRWHCYSTPRCFWPLVVQGRECYWHRDWTLLRTPPQTCYNLTWFYQMSHITLISLVSLAVET